jgi:hypothetical protein
VGRLSVIMGDAAEWGKQAADRHKRFPCGTISVEIDCRVG